MAEGFEEGLKNCPEIISPVKLTLEGNWPSYIRGTLYRNGPGVFEVDCKNGKKFRFKHWFDGLTMVHRFLIDGDSDTPEIHYSNRFMASEIKEKIEQQNGIGDMVTFGEDPCLSVFGKSMAFFKSIAMPPPANEPQNIGVTLGLTKGVMYSKTDASALMAFDPETLERKEFVTYEKFGDKYKGQLAAAHSQYDHETKETINYTLEFGAASTYRVFTIPEEGPSRLLAQFTGLASYMHSFSMTKKYVILCVWPLEINAFKLLWSRSIVSSMQWKPELGTQIYVIDRSEKNLGLVARYHSLKAFYSFHSVNAWDDDNGNVVMDLVAYDNADIVTNLEAEKLKTGEAQKEKDIGDLRRYTLLKVEEVGERQKESMPDCIPSTDIEEETLLAKAKMELPRINQDFHLKKHKYTYALSSGAIRKYCDGEDPKYVDWCAGERFFASEAIFVANPDGTEEDDGVLLTVILDSVKCSSSLKVLDAQTMTEIGSAETPCIVPHGFHGNYFHSKESGLTRCDQ